jgi:hypothetical protein
MAKKYGNLDADANPELASLKLPPSSPRGCGGVCAMWVGRSPTINIYSFNTSNM